MGFVLGATEKARKTDSLIGMLDGAIFAEATAK